MSRHNQSLFPILLSRITCLLLILIIVFSSCRKKYPSEPCDNLSCNRDSCETKINLSSGDSLAGNIPLPTYTVENLFQSSRGIIAGTAFLAGWNNNFGTGGFIFDPYYHVVLGFYGSEFGGWTRDGRYLLVSNGFNGITLLDINT